MDRRKLLLGVALSLSLLPAQVMADDAAAYPNKPVRIVVPFASGGSSELLARMLAQGLTQELGQTFYVETRPGAGSAIGSSEVARANADGYTLLMTSPTGVIITPATNEVDYDPVADFVHIAILGEMPDALVVRADSDIVSVEDFLDRAQAEPGSILMGNAGTGSTGHLKAKLLEQHGDIELRHVAYSGAGPASIGLLSGEVDAMFMGVPNARSALDGNQVRVLAVSSGERSAALPDAPSIAEAVPGAESVAWFGLAAPSAVPSDVIAMIEEAAVAVVSSPEFMSELVAMGVSPSANNGTNYFTDYIAQDRARWIDILAGL